MKEIMKRTVVVASLVTLLLGCGKKDMDTSRPPPVGPPSPRPPLANIPSITSYTITNYCKRKITIEGTNFSADISKDSIYFGKEKGIVE